MKCTLIHKKATKCSLCDAIEELFFFLKESWLIKSVKNLSKQSNGSFYNIYKIKTVLHIHMSIEKQFSTEFSFEDSL